MESSSGFSFRIPRRAWHDRALKSAQVPDIDADRTIGAGVRVIVLGAGAAGMVKPALPPLFTPN